MKKLFAAFLAFALMVLPLTGLAATGKSSIFGTGSVGTDAEEPEDIIDIVEEGDDDSGSTSAEAIRAQVSAYLDSIGWKYNLDEEEIVFNMSIDSKLGSLSYRLRFFENGFTSYAYPNVYADSNSMANIAEYLCRANYGLRNGNFEIDFRDGEIRYKSYVDCSDGVPGDEVIRRSISVPGDMFEIYGDGLLQVSFGMMTPEDALNAAEAD